MAQTWDEKGNAIQSWDEHGKPITGPSVDPLSQQTQAAASGAGISHPGTASIPEPEPELTTNNREMTRGMYGQTPDSQYEAGRVAGGKQAGVDTAAGIVGGVAAPVLSKAATYLPDSIGLALRTEGGELKTGAKLAGRAIGAGLGYEVGGPTGAVIGGLSGEGLLDSSTPKFPENIPTKGIPTGGPLPDTDEFYARRGKDLASRRETPNEASFSRAKSSMSATEPEPVNPIDLDSLLHKNAATVAPSRPSPSIEDEVNASRVKEPNTIDPEWFNSLTAQTPEEPPAGPPPKPGLQKSGVGLYPEPREPLPEDKPGVMYSVKRGTILPQSAERGAPGAGDVLKNTGKPILYTPREGVGYPGPRPESIGTPIGEPTSQTGLRLPSSTPEDVVKQAGAKFVGIQKGYGVRPDMVLFQPGDNGTTLSVDIDKLSPQAILDKIKASPVK